MIYDLEYRKNNVPHFRTGVSKEQIDESLSTITNEHVRKSVRIDAYKGTEFVETFNASWNPIETKSWADLYPDMPIV